MQIPSASTDRYIYFVAVDATDLVTREPGLSSFTVYRSRNGAAEVLYTTPTITEIDATNMPGVYALLLDEDTTLTGTHGSEEYVVHITHAGMAPVTRAVEIFALAAESILAACANKIADHVLRRTTANVEASSNGDTLGARSLYGGVANLVHKRSIASGTLTVTKADDTTALTTMALTATAGSDPITAIDPAA